MQYPEDTTRVVIHFHNTDELESASLCWVPPNMDLAHSGLARPGEEDVIEEDMDVGTLGCYLVPPGGVVRDESLPFHRFLVLWGAGAQVRVAVAGTGLVPLVGDDGRTPQLRENFLFVRVRPPWSVFSAWRESDEPHLRLRRRVATDTAAMEWPDRVCYWLAFVHHWYSPASSPQAALLWKHRIAAHWLIALSLCALELLRRASRKDTAREEIPCATDGELLDGEDSSGEAPQLVFRRRARREQEQVPPANDDEDVERKASVQGSVVTSHSLLLCIGVLSMLSDHYALTTMEVMRDRYPYRVIAQCFGGPLFFFLTGANKPSYQGKG